MHRIAKYSGFSLLISGVLILLTLVLHPVGGSLEHLQKIARIAIISHAIAILSIPFSIFGYLGLSQILGPQNQLAKGASITMILSQIAVLLAAALNGLVLPIFLKRVDLASDSRATISTILEYNFSINQAMDLIFMAGMCISIFLWSLLVIKQKMLPIWLGFAGLVISVVFIISILGGFNLSDVNALRTFMLAILSWTIVVGALLVFRNSRFSDQ